MLNRNFFRVSKFAYLGLLVAMAGCGGSSGIGRVTGTVQMDGKPLPDAIVSFFPQGLEGAAATERGSASFGRTDAEGKYELQYNRSEKGAEVGKHKVQISTMIEGGGGDYGANAPEIVPARYNTKTELIVEVSSGRNQIDFMDLTSEGEIAKARGY